MKPIKSEPVKTALTIVTGFILIGLVFQIKWAITLALVIGVISLLSLKLALMIEKLWFGLSKVLSYIVPNIVLGIVFFLLLLPVSVLSKVFRKKDTLQLKNTGSTVFKDVNRSYDKLHFEQMW